MLFNGAKILVPTNGSPAGQEGFRWACKLVHRTRSQLHAVYVAEIPLESSIATEFVQQDSRGEQVLQLVEDIAAAEKCKVNARLIQARHAGPAINEEAERTGMELIVLGVPQQGGLAVPVLGSTAAFLLEEAPCPVIVYRVPNPTDGRALG